MANKFIEANYKDGKNNLTIGVRLVLWQEDGIYYQYAPELDITGYGKTESEAKSSFEFILKDFVIYTLHKNTFFDELERLGWTTNKKKKRLRAPEEEQLLEDNETYRHLINMPNITTSHTDVALQL